MWSRRRFMAAVCVALVCLIAYFQRVPYTAEQQVDNDARWRLATARRVSELRRKLKDYYPPGWNHDGPRMNYMALDRLAACLEQGNCPPGSDTVILLVSHHFAQARDGWAAGEEVWAHSVHMAFDSLNYTLLYAVDDSEMLFIYRSIPDLIPILLLQPSNVEKCVARNNSYYLDQNLASGFPIDWETPGRHGCVKRVGYEEGIPLWKMFSWAWWEAPLHPMGRIWTLGPEDWGYFKHNLGNTYLGYSVQDRCERIPFYEQREHRGLVLAKRADYMTGNNMAWPDILPDIISSVPQDENGRAFELLATASGSLGDKFKGVRNVGPMDRNSWLNEVAKSKFMLAVGRPYLSPSPYDALCFGVPFINVIYSRNKNDPEDRKQWRTQHDALKFFDPPYVYHVLEKSAEELSAAILGAINNPIGRWIPPAMTLDATRERHLELATHDWRSRASTEFPELYEPSVSLTIRFSLSLTYTRT
ncbi:hypothetical protein IAR55_005681 [Kwoniella newhampshirensis]|uniref:Glycosyltransferase family 18 catalytic domain-containing protein n=1 Tax=Kwoniella newhampshirensis TaxID=1651941 RepID=A0AAW0YUK3_9TREE